MDAVCVDATRLSRLHFGLAQLGDARRSKRLVKTAELIFKSPFGSLPTKLPAWKDLMGLYRLLNAEQVTHQAIIGPHCRWVREQMQQCDDVVLLVHDTTELEFTSHKKVSRELSQLGNGLGRGFLCHNTLAIKAGGEVIGLVSQILHLRRQVPRGESSRQKKEHADRESLLWQRGCEQTASSAGKLHVDVCDRGADSFEFLEYEHSHGRRYVIRSCRDRQLNNDDHDLGIESDQHLGSDYHLGSDRIHQKLHGFARDLPRQFTREVQVAASTTKGTKARLATVAIGYSPLILQAPAQPRGHCQLQSIATWVIHVQEIHPPAEAQGLEWVLLSNLPIENNDQAAQRVDWYSRRPMIEDFHKGQKTGLGIELPQFESKAKLEPMIGLLSVIAAVLLQLRSIARSEESQHIPAKQMMPDLWVKIVAASAYRFKAKPSRDWQDLSINEFFIGIAKLGGFLARKHDGSPGWQTLWRGWQKLHQLINGAQMVIEKCV